VPGFILKVGLGEVADVLLTGQKVQPVRAQDAGFTFRFTEVNTALRDIVSKRSSERRSA
jgi:NAD dependent epimerase/dehydratase family enzyme